MMSLRTPLIVQSAAALLLLAGFACGGSGDSDAAGGGGAVNTTALTVSSTSRVAAVTDVLFNATITATFHEAMDAATIGATAFIVRQRSTMVPAAKLAPDAVLARGPAPVRLRTAGNFVVLAKSGIDTIPTSALTGHVGVSPIDSTAVTGFSLTMHSSGAFSTSDQIFGKAYAADYALPTPSNLTTAVSNMEAAYIDAAGRLTPDFTELGDGDVGGLTLVPGLYKWDTAVLIATDITLEGGPNDIWIFQIEDGITVAAGAKVVLSGGALPKNIFWQTAGAVAIDTTAHVEGVILSQAEITLAPRASVNGRLLSQAGVTLDGCTVTQPAP